MTERAGAAPFDLDVVIVTYNSAEHLASCVGALPAGTRVIVVDNASTDGSAATAEQLGCVVIRNSENAGFGRAVNRAVREHGRAPNLLLLNPDARVDRRNLELLLAAFDDAEVGVAGPRLTDPEGRDQRPWWEFPAPAIAWREALGLHRFAKIDFGRTADVPFVVGACFLVRTDAFRAVGGFDERYWLYGEEVDLCRRLRDAGRRTRYVAEAHATHVGGASGSPNEADLIDDHFTRGTERFVLTHQGRIALISFRAAVLTGAALRLLALRRGDPRRGARLAQLRRSARSLARHPARITPAPSPATSRSLVVASLEAWDDVWRRNQFLVRELTRADPSLRVLFVEPANDPLHDLLVRRVRPAHIGADLRPVPGFPHIIRFRPAKLAPRRFGKWVDRSLARQVTRAAARAELVEPALWINDLSLTPLAAECAWPVVYDVTDDWLDAAGTERRHAELFRQEEWLLDRADEVVVCSGELARRKGRGRSVHTIPNAVDAAHFTRARPRPGDLPRSPVAVYVGTLHDERIDVPLLVRTAEALPEVQFALVGPSALGHASTERLSRARNVHLLGARPYDDVPAYLQHADVVVIPHLVSAFTESLDPIKAYECAVVGRPTVATPVAGFRELGAVVRCAEPARFADAVRGALLDAPAEQPVGSSVEVPSWRDRAAEFGAVLEAARRRARRAPGAQLDDRADDRPGDRPLRVLRIWHSGVSRAWRERERQLRDTGVDVHLLAAHSWNEGGVDVAFEPDDDALASPVRVFGSHPFVFAYDPRPIYRRLRDERTSFVDLEEEPASLAAFEFLVLRALARSRAPFALYSAQNIEKRYPPPFRWIERAALARASAVRVCNGDAGRIMANKGFRGRIELIGLGADTERLGQVAHPPHPGFRVGYVGRLEDRKGVHVLIDAVALVPDVTLEIVGEGPERASLEARVRARGIEDRVTFTGHASHADLPRIYASLDVVAIPSLPTAGWLEQFGRVAVEAMAAGVPVVASDSGELTAVVGEAGLLVPPGDHEALAAAIRRLVSDAGLRATLAAAGRKHAARYSWPSIAAAHRRLYADLVDDRPAP